MNDLGKLMRVEEKLNEITNLIHENYQGSLLKKIKKDIYKMYEKDIFKRIAIISEENFQGFQYRREYRGVVENLEFHSIRILSGIREQIEHIQDLEKQKDQLKNELEREKYLNLKYRQGYTTDFYVYLSTILWMKSSSYHSSDKKIIVFRKIPTELLKIIGNYSGVLWTIKIPENLNNN